MLGTINDVIREVSEQALVSSGDSLTVDGHKAAKVVAQNVPLAKEAYEHLLLKVQSYTEPVKKGQLDVTSMMMYGLVLMALAGGIANVTGDNSYVARLEDLTLQ